MAFGLLAIQVPGSSAVEDHTERATRGNAEGIRHYAGSGIVRKEQVWGNLLRVCQGFSLSGMEQAGDHPSRRLLRRAFRRNRAVKPLRNAMAPKRGRMPLKLRHHGWHHMDFTEMREQVKRAGFVQM